MITQSWSWYGPNLAESDDKWKFHKDKEKYFSPTTGQLWRIKGKNLEIYMILYNRSWNAPFCKY